MPYFTLLETFVNNSSVMAARVNNLSNTFKNLGALIAIILLCQYKNTRINYCVIVISTFVKIKAMSTAALTNTLFSIHPPLLYICLSLSIFYLYRYGRKRLFTPLSLLLLSMLLGGFWSMQELSWGGWWNWDVLECGIAYIWVIFAIVVHRPYLRTICYRPICCLLISLLCYGYNTLNKLGLATSIHSFVSSQSTKNHYAAIVSAHIIIALIVFVKYIYVPIVLLAVIILSYLNLKWCIFFKKPALYLIIMATNRPIIYALCAHTWHRIIFLSLIVVCAINFNNASLSYQLVSRVKHITSNLSGGFPGIDFYTVRCDRVIWRNLFLAKPKYSYGCYLNSISGRSVNCRQSILTFLK